MTKKIYEVVQAGYENIEVYGSFSDKLDADIARTIVEVELTKYYAMRDHVSAMMDKIEDEDDSDDFYDTNEEYNALQVVRGAITDDLMSTIGVGFPEGPPHTTPVYVRQVEVSESLKEWFKEKQG